MPDWITTDIKAVDDESVPDETLQFETPELDFVEEDELVVEEREIVAEQEQQDFEEVFLIAKNKLHNGEFEEAFPRLRQLLDIKEWQDQVIETLVYDIENYHPIEVETWVLLGDTYNKQGRLQEALDAYTKAEEFIK